MTSLDLEKLKFLKRKFRILNFHKQCFPEMKIVFLRFGIQKQHFFHHPTKMPHTSKVAPLYGIQYVKVDIRTNKPLNAHFRFRLSFSVSLMD